MLSYREYTDNELFCLLKQGKHGAYAEIYKRYWASLFRHARKILQNDEEAKDVVQDIFTTLWLKAPEINLTSSLSTFLYASVRNKIFDLIDKNKVRRNYLASLESFIVAAEATTENQIHEKELALLIEKEFAALPPKMREVFELSRKSDLSYKEIADKLDISDNTVKKQISNALKILRPRLSDLLIIIFWMKF
ncbi:RNA polymerase sigma factor [Solitalea koreensis]|uniref:RNA polymerase sigma-70 factor, ECF subfamily n=1 Tax=Solitalea koreensis TaxID=543615 RepID=A0A521AVH6_9SPHI|nr:RNA polymerase sigma-70 factor [Solitalea koreensis]SMO38819.1 RNA polymerase sigma-70 factor, ECF subfamily [Solitalea koreensis]